MSLDDLLYSEIFEQYEIVGSGRLLGGDKHLMEEMTLMERLEQVQSSWYKAYVWLKTVKEAQARGLAYDKSTALNKERWLMKSWLKKSYI